MRKLALALATAATLGFAAPALAYETQPAPLQAARADVVKVKTVRHRPGVRKVVVRERVVHRHGPRYGARKVVVVKKHRPHHRTVAKKKIIIRR